MNAEQIRALDPDRTVVDIYRNPGRPGYGYVPDVRDAVIFCGVLLREIAAQLAEMNARKAHTTPVRSFRAWLLSLRERFR